MHVILLAILYPTWIRSQLLLLNSLPRPLGLELGDVWASGTGGGGKDFASLLPEEDFNISRRTGFKSGNSMVER